MKGLKSSLLIFAFSASSYANTYYIDKNLSADCVGNYSFVNRDCSGSDGNAYNNPEDLFSYRDGPSLLQPGDTVTIRGGTYNSTSESNSNNPMFSLETSGTEAELIRILAAPEELVIFDADVNNNAHALYVSGNYIHLEGIHFTKAKNNGVFLDQVNHVTLKNCKAYENSESLSSGSGGIHTRGGSHIVIDGCESYRNANGLVLSAVGWPDPDAATGGCVNCVIQNGRFYDNTKTQNPGNSDGIVTRFAHKALIRNNIVYGNPDGGLDLLGTTNSIAEYNLVYDNFRTGGNGEGIKTCVRGGGGNIVRYNVVYDNKRGIQDACFGDIVYNNTIFNNSGWGLTIDQTSLHSFFFNNLSFMNETSDAFQSSLVITSTVKEFRQPGGITSDHNFIADGDFFWLDKGDHSLSGDPETAVVDPDLPDVHPLEGGPLIDKGFDLDALSSLAESKIPEIIATANQFIQDPNWTNCPDALCRTSAGKRNRFQSTVNWARVVEEFQNGDTSYFTNLSGPNDFDNNPVPMGTHPEIGAYEFGGPPPTPLPSPTPQPSPTPEPTPNPDPTTDPDPSPQRTGFQSFKNILNPTKNESINILFELEKSAIVSLIIYDRLGREVITLIAESRPAGQHTKSWDGRNTIGETVASGVYLAVLKAGEDVYTRKIVVIQ